MGKVVAFYKVTGKSSEERLQYPTKLDIDELPPNVDFGRDELLFGSTEEELLAEMMDKVEKPFGDLECLVANLS